jgi:hypothetical protein
VAVTETVGTEGKPESKAKPYKTGPLPGGQLPDVGTLFSETMAEFMDNIGPYAMAGLGQMLVVFPVTFIAIFVMYGVLALGWGGSIVLTGVLSGIAANVSEELAELVAMFGLLGSMFVPLLLMIPLFVGIIALFAPMSASLYRAMAAHQRGEKQLELGSSFSTMGQGLVSVIVAALIVGTLAMLGAMMCYLPVIAVSILFGFTMGFVALHRVGAMQAARMSMQHALAHLNWYVMFGILSLVLGMVAYYIPVVGPMFAVSFHVRAYRSLFGDGVEPNLAS